MANATQNLKDPELPLFGGSQSVPLAQAITRRKFFAGVLWSELFALWLEFFYKFGVTHNPKGFAIAIPLYFFFLWGLHALFATLEGMSRHRLVCTIIGGLAGLAVEWFLVGNSPWRNPKALQSAQFLFHAVYPVLGYLLVRAPEARTVRRPLLLYMTIASIVSALGFAMENPNWGKLWFIFLPILPFLGLLYFVYRLAGSQTTVPRNAELH